MLANWNVGLLLAGLEPATGKTNWDAGAGQRQAGWWLADKATAGWVLASLVLATGEAD